MLLVMAALLVMWVRFPKAGPMSMQMLLYGMLLAGLYLVYFCAFQVDPVPDPPWFLTALQAAVGLICLCSAALRGPTVGAIAVAIFCGELLTASLILFIRRRKRRRPPRQ